MDTLRTVLPLAFAAACSAAAAAPAYYEGAGEFMLAPRTALVIGVPSVQQGSGFLSLKNPKNDAAAVTAALRDVGFTVFAPHENYTDDKLTRQAIKHAIYDFALALRASPQGVGVVYFSGHGIQSPQMQRTFVVPYDGFVRYGRDLNEELIPVGMVYDAFAYAGNVLNILILDACRDFPYPQLSEFGTSRFDTAEKDSPAVYRASATLSGSKAADGSARELSPYARAFVDALAEPDLGLGEVFKRVASRLKDDGEKQVPTIAQAGDRDFVFRPTVVSFNREQQVFKAGGQRSMYQHLFEKFAGGYFGRAAQLYAESAPLPPPPVAAIEVAQPARLNAAAAPAAPSVAVVAGQTVLQVTGLEFSNAGRSWVPVLSPEGKPAFVDKAATVAAPPPKAVRVNVAFEAAAAAGTEKLTDAAAQALRAALPGTTAARTSARVVGYRIATAGGAAQPDQQMLVRQAAVTEVLKAAGVEVRRVASETQPAGNANAADSIAVELTTEPGA